MNVSAPVKKPRRKQPITIAGSGKGALGNLGAFSAFNKESKSVALVPNFVDPVPGKAEEVKGKAELMGLTATATEDTIENVIANGGIDRQPIFVNTDRPEGAARTLVAAENLNSPILGFILVKLPSGELWGVRFLVRPGDTEARRLGVKFFAKLGELTARRGSAAIIGAQGDLADRASEARYREWFRTFTKENLAKLIAGTEPTGNTFEVTDDGSTTYALLLRESATWTEPRELEQAVKADPPVPLIRGESFVIGEITGEGIQFHKGRRRQTDDAVSLQGVGLIDNASVDAERQKEQAAEALRLAERQRVSRRSPVLTTD